jgi:malonyl-CoA O-methyltransferase
LNHPRNLGTGRPLQAVELALPGKRASRAAFARASATFADACVVHDWARERLLDRLELVRIGPGTIVDLGCATGSGAAALARRFPTTRIVAVDASLAMLAAARRTLADCDLAHVAAGDAERLPFPSASVALLFANLVLPWCWPEAVFREAARVLAPGGLSMFATLGPDSLKEVRGAWARVDDRIHVHGAFDMHDLGDLAGAAGLKEPVVDVERIALSYADVRDLVRDLRACGAVNTARGRRTSLTGPSRWRGFERALETKRHDARFEVTMEVIFIQAWGGRPAARRGANGDEIVVPLNRVGHRERSREPGHGGSANSDRLL